MTKKRETEDGTRDNAAALWRVASWQTGPEPKADKGIYDKKSSPIRTNVISCVITPRAAPSLTSKLHYPSSAASCLIQAQ